MMHGDSRVMVVVCLETTSLPAPCLSTSTFPGSREEPFVFPVTGNLVSTRYRQAGGLARLDSRRLPAGRAPGMARVNPDRQIK